MNLWIRRKLTRLVFLLFMGFTLIVNCSHLVRSQNLPTHQTTEIRGVWLTNIDSDVLFHRDNLSNAIDTLSELNFNTLYPTVWNWGYTLYPSIVAKKVTGHYIDPVEGLQKRNILKEIIAHSHRKGMAVIPWFEFGFMAPADSQLAERHPQWLTQRQDKSTIWWEGKVHQRVWLNPLHPEVQQFITALVTEIVSTYAVDGIQFDDHFGFPSDFGYDDYTVKLYQQEHEGKSPPSDYLDRDWIGWRADKITDYMTQLYRTIKDSNPQAIVSLSPNPQTFSLESFLLDWHKWERLGLIDELILQVYRTDMTAFEWELSQSELQLAKKHIPVAIGILAGLKGRPIAIENVITQVETIRHQGFAGVSFFFYESLWNLAQEPLKARQATFKKLFPSPIERYHAKISNPSGLSQDD